MNTMKSLFVVAMLCGLALGQFPAGQAAGASEEQTVHFGEYNAEAKIINDQDVAKYHSCVELNEAGYKTNGTYRITVNGSSVLAPCLFAIDFIYLIILARHDGAVSFDRNMAQYEKAFGNVLGDYWIGLETIHALTTTEKHNILDVHFWDWNDLYTRATYNYFEVAGKDEQWRLTINDFHGDPTNRISNALMHNNGQPFTTPDQPNQHKCAIYMRAGWWFNFCSYALPTGNYYVDGNYHKTGPYFNGIFWYNYFRCNPYGYSMKRLILSVRVPVKGAR